MSAVKLLVLALALWLPAASFAGSAAASVEGSSLSCEENGADDDACFAEPAAPVVSPVGAHPHDSFSRPIYSGHCSEPLYPPPNPAALR